LNAVNSLYPDGTGNEIFCESDVVLWDYFVDQIKRVSQKWFITPRWCSQFDDTVIQLVVTVQGQTLTLEDAIDVLTEEENPWLIVLLGEVGAGKTTMALQLVQNWCMTGSNCQFALVIYVNMAQHADKAIDLPGLISLHLERVVDSEMVDSMCNTLVKQQGEGLLVILDGYDEVKDGDNNFIKELLNRSCLPKSTLLLVCQPGYVTGEEYQVKTIQIPLLRYDQVEEYIRGTVGRRGIALIRSSPIWPMMYNPLLLAIVCHLIFHSIDITRLSTLTQLYHTLVIKLISDQVKRVSYSGDHSATVRSLLNSCAEASYEAMFHCRHFVTDIRDVNTIVESGLLVKHHDVFYFTHYTFLEFFTAYHIAHASNFDPYTLKVNSNYSLFLPFLSGLTGKMTCKTEETGNNSLVVASVCYSEAKSPITGRQHFTVEKSALPSEVLVLSNDYSLTPHQQLSIKTFMEECKGATTLDMSGFDTKKMEHAMSLILNCKYLKSVNAVNINITEDKCLAIADTLKTNTSLVNLNLSHNTSIANGPVITAIAVSLTINNHLQTLSLSYCNLTSRFAEQIIASLLSNTSLLQIDLSNNLIEIINIDIITEVLQRAIVQVIR